MSVKEAFSLGLPKPPVAVSQPMPSMRLAYAPDGTAVYKPVPAVAPPPYQGVGAGGGGGGPGGGGGGAGGVAGSNMVASAATTVVAPVRPISTEGPGYANSPIGASPGLNISSGDTLKRKRGRPRKYGPDGTMARALVPVTPTMGGASPGSGAFSPTSPTGAAGPFSHSRPATVMKKAMGRPPGSGKKQQLAALGSGGIGFTPHVITVLAGEDVSSKIMSFSNNGPRAICILSANGAISTATLRQAATSGGTVTYEGRFEILSLSGSYLLSENDGQRSRTGGLSVCLAGPDGRVLGGGVAGLLTAASPVQVVVGSFIADGRKESKPVAPVEPPSAPGKLASGGMMGTATPPLRASMSESSEGPGSPLNQSTGGSNDSNKPGIPTMHWN